MCPACRQPYSENPADFKPLTSEEIAKIKAEKRQKDQAKKLKISENRKHLANVRVVQKNLVFVVGLSQRLADPEILKKLDYFGKFGKIHKVVINHSTQYAGSQIQVPVKFLTFSVFTLISPGRPINNEDLVTLLADIFKYFRLDVNSPGRVRNNCSEQKYTLGLLLS